MKKIILTIFLILLVLPLVYASSDSPDLTITLLSQNPDPVEPGQVVKVKFKIENEGAESDKDAIVKISSQHPFSIYNDVAEKNIGKLRASSTGADAEIVEFKLKVSESAVEEETELSLSVQIGESSYVYDNDEFLIDIETHDAILDITSITSEPEQVAPGEVAEVNIMIKNQADSLLKDIRFKLDFNDDIPLAPYQSSSERRVAQLKSGFQNSLEFKFVAEPGASPGLYKVPLNITYNDEKGNSYSINDILAVTIGESPNLKTYLKRSTVQSAGTGGKITIELANAGSADLKFLELTILDSDDFNLITTSNYFYIGDVDSDDTESEEIDVYINKGVEKLLIPVQLKYFDVNNQPFQQKFDLELQLYNNKELKKFGLVEANNTWVYLLIFAILIGGYFVYRSKKKHKK